MKKHCIIYLLAALSLASCIDDEGNNTMNPINKAQIEGIKDKYYMVTNLETLQIPVTVTGSMSGMTSTRVKVPARKRLTDYEKNQSFQAT